MNKLNLSKRERTGQIFESRFLEFFTRTSPRLTLVYYGTLYLLLLALHFMYAGGSILVGTAVYLGALFFWTLFEYLMHRYIFHFINEQEWSKKMHYAIHGVHHTYPRDEERLFMPPLPGTVVIALVFGIFYLMMGTHAFLFMAGFLNGWGFYVFIHFFVHTYQPVKPFKFLWTHHARHHYQDSNTAYGVSSPLWDYVFGTMPKAS